MTVDHLLTFWPLLIIYVLTLMLVAIVLAYFERRRLVRRMYHLRHEAHHA
jgi:Mg2+/citrate symporter